MLYRRSHARRSPSQHCLPSLAFSLLLTALVLIARPVLGQTAVRLPHHVPQWAIAQAHLLGAVPDQQTVKLSFALPLRNQQELNQLLARLYDPKDPLYGHYLTPAQFTAEFGPSQTDIDAVERFAASRGLAVTGVSGNHTIVSAEGPASSVNTAFAVRLRSYSRADGSRFYAPNMDPAVPGDIAGRIIGIVGLDNARIFRPLYARPEPLSLSSSRQAHVGNGPDGSGLTPANVKTAYNLNGASYNGTALDGIGQTMGVYEFDGYLPTDIQTYETQYGLPNVPLQNVLVDGATASPVTAGGQSEVTLDIELSIALAPKISKLYVYTAPDTNQGAADIINRIASDDLAKSTCICWGSPEDQSNGTVTANSHSEPLYTAESQALQQMATQGQSVFVAAGDNGAYDDLSEPNTLQVDDPGSQQDDTDVGGTTISLNANGTYASETTWDDPGSDSAGGGGISTLWSIPSYQSPVVDSSSDTELSKTMRNVPDVCLNADPNVGYSTYATLKNDPADSGWTPIGGTSCGAPLWSSLAALMNQERALNGTPTIGLANNDLYTIAQGADYSSDFHDIKNDSNNFYYHALPGFDDATGLGSFNGLKLLAEPLIAGVALNSTITGSVATGNPATGVGGATVSLSLTSTGQVLQTVQTANDGSYSIAAPAGDNVTLNATAPSYYTGNQQVTAPASGQTLSGVDISLTPSPHTFPAGIQLVSSPYDYTGTALSSILSPGPVEAAVWDPSITQYVLTPTSPADTFHLGRGYWINPADSAWLNQPGTPAPASPFSISLPAGWNMIGDPFTSPAALSSLTVTLSGGTQEPYATAETNGDVSALYSYSSGAYQTVDSGGSLTPWTGYWIENTSGSAITLTVPNP